MVDLKNYYEEKIMRSSCLQAAYRNVPGLVEKRISNEYPIEDGLSLFVQSVIQLNGYIRTNRLTDPDNLLGKIFDDNWNAQRTQLGERLFKSIEAIAKAYDDKNITASTSYVDKVFLEFFITGLFLVTAHALLVGGADETRH